MLLFSNIKDPDTLGHLITIHQTKTYSEVKSTCSLLFTQSSGSLHWVSYCWELIILEIFTVQQCPSVSETLIFWWLLKSKRSGWWSLVHVLIQLWLLCSHPNFTLFLKLKSPIPWHTHSMTCWTSSQTCLYIYTMFPKGWYLLLLVIGRAYVVGRQDVNTLNDVVLHKVLLSSWFSFIHSDQVKNRSMCW